MTPNLPQWNPHTEEYKEQEFVMVDYNSNIQESKLRKQNDISNKIMAVEIERCFDDIGYDPDILIHRICQIDSLNNDKQTIAVTSSNIRKSITTEEMATRLNIPIGMASQRHN